MTKPPPKKDKSLTPEAFAALLRWLSPDYQQGAVLYLELRDKLVRYFIRKGCMHSQDLADRTLDRVARIAHDAPDKYTNPEALGKGVAKNVWLEYLREPAWESPEDDGFPAVIRHEEEFSDCQIDCLGSCLAELSTHHRNLITQYHGPRGHEKIEVRRQLAEEIGGFNKLRIAAFRIRGKLHDCISGCVRRSASEEGSEVVHG